MVKRKDTKLFCFFLDGFIAGFKSAAVVFAPISHISPQKSSNIGAIYQLALPPIRDCQEMVDVMDWLARGELATRIDREYRGEPIGEPVYIALAEVPQIADPIGRLLRQGRQYDLCFIGAMQDSLTKTLGIPSGLRECFRSAYYCGGDQTTARALLDLSRNQLNEDGLGVDGRVYLKTARMSAQEVRVPWASNESIRLLLGNTATNTDPLPSSPFVAGVSLVAEAETSDAHIISEEERNKIIAVRKSGVKRHDMCKALQKGSKYYKVIQQVLDAEGL